MPQRRPTGVRYFDQLGDEIAQTWSRFDFAPGLLPELAGNALAQSRPCDHVRYQDILAFVATARNLPVQANPHSGFGQPPATVYWHPQFYIDVLFWTTGTTSVHQHGFWGSFAVLEGSSVHSQYTFHARDRVDATGTLGDLVLDDVGILVRGDVRPIVAGPEFIHAVFHLDMPSVTVVVRTPTTGERVDYFRPHLALDASAHEDPVRRRRLQALDLLERLGGEQYEKVAIEALADADLCTTFQILSRARARRGSAPSSWARCMAAASSRHGARAHALIPVLEEAERTVILTTRRQKVTNRDHRFLLALLLNLTDRASILAMINQRYPHCAPRDKVMAWVDELSETDTIGLEMDELNRLVFGHLLDGCSPAEVLTRLSEQYCPEDIESQRTTLDDHIELIRSSPIFRTLFA